MATLWFYARYAERPASWGRYFLVVASFALGLTAKPMLVTLPFVLLLLDCWPLERIQTLARSASEGNVGWVERSEPHQKDPPKKRWGSLRSTHPTISLLVEKIPLFVLAAASCVVTLAAQRVAIQSLEKVAFSRRVANAAVAYVAYLGKMVYPAGLAVVYPLPKDPPPAWEVAGAVAVLLAISTAAFVVRRKCPYLLFGWLWYLGTLVPVIGLVQVGSQAMADRYTYLTQIGLYAAIAWGVADVARSRPYRRLGLAALSALVAAALMLCAWHQTCYWRNSETLWTRALACTSQNRIAHSNLGLALAERGQVDEAIAHYWKALEIEPDYVEAHCNLGLALAGRGQVDEAIAHYWKALEIEPDYVEAHCNLGIALARRGRVDEAIAHYRRALEINPDYAEAHNNLGNALAGHGKIDEAIAEYRKALKINPDYVDAHYNLALALAARGQVDEAIAQYRRALEIKPDFAMAHNNLGFALAGRGDVDEAIAQYRRALEIKPGYVEAQCNLGLALAGRGQVDEALVHYRKALALALARNNMTLADAIRAQIRRLQSAAPAGKTP
jgi:tetratricopeptide (TPR) repeat protein